MKYDYDLFVIGAGSAGVRASRIAANLGAKVAIAEEYRVGGTCVIRGCVPKKLLVFASHIKEDIEAAKGYGWDVPKPTFNWQKLIANKDAEIDRLNGLYINTLGNAGATLYNGKAVITGQNNVAINGKKITAKTILVAVGGWPNLPNIDGIEHAITSNEALHLNTFPKHITIVGGGYIAVEFAGIFNGLGAKVTQLYRGDTILRGFDGDLAQRLTTEIRAKGINLQTGTNVEKIEKTETGLRLHLTDGSHMATDAVMYATGRKPKTDGLGLENADVITTKNGAIKVDPYGKTNIDTIYAAGDVTDRIQLTPVAIKEGHAFALTVFGNTPTAPELDPVPSAIFSQPPIGTVGLSEEVAIEKGFDVAIYSSDFLPMKHTLGGNKERAFTKLIVDKKTDKILGAHMIGLDAPEIIQGIGIAVKAGLTKKDFDSTVAIHPSSAEEFVLMPTPKR